LSEPIHQSNRTHAGKKDHNTKTNNMSGIAAQRKAWNEAMRTAAGASALHPSLQPQRQKRRSDRRKKQDRRDKARKVQSLVGSDEHQEFLAAVWMDALEDVDPSAGLAQDDDEEYDALDELDDKKSKKRRKGGSSAVKAGVLPKRFIPRPLGSILVEEANREEGAARAFIDAEARILNPNEQLPRRKFCPVTGLEGIYTEPKSGIPYASLKALEQIRERAPPWMTLGGTPTYWEAAKSLRDEE
jgi:hypothetical protein